MNNENIRTIPARLLALGYVQVHERDNIVTKLWREHGVYHVRKHDHANHVRMDWQVCLTLNEARKHFRSMTNAR